MVNNILVFDDYQRRDAVEYLKGISPQKRAINDRFVIPSRYAENPSKCLNGGDYHRWYECHLVTPGLYKFSEQWSAEYPIEDYHQITGYLVIEQGFSPSLDA